MSEHLRVERVSHVGINHVENFTGDRLDPTVNGTVLVVRRYIDGQLASVHTRTRVDCVDWFPNSKEINS